MARLSGYTGAGTCRPLFRQPSHPGAAMTALHAAKIFGLALQRVTLPMGLWASLRDPVLVAGQYREFLEQPDWYARGWLNPEVDRLIMLGRHPHPFRGYTGTTAHQAAGHLASDTLIGAVQQIAPDKHLFGSAEEVAADIKRLHQKEEHKNYLWRALSQYRELLEDWLQEKMAIGREIRKELQLEHANLIERLSADRTEPDGPVEPNGFRFKNAIYPLGGSGLQYRLLDVLWDSPAGRPHHSVPFEDVKVAVYGNTDAEDKTDGALEFQVRKLGGFFAGHSLPFTTHSRAGKVWITAEKTTQK